MAIKVYNPTSPGRRGMTSSAFDEITKSKPEKALTVPLKKHAGRNNAGRISAIANTVRHRGGGHKRKYRLIDASTSSARRFKRNKDGIPGRVAAIEYDPNRSANIALIVYADGQKRYILHPHGLTVGQKIQSGPEAEIEVGNALQIADIPVGTSLHAIELQPGRGAQLVRSAGTSAQLMAKEGKYGTIRLPSGEMRKVHVKCRATIGQVGNIDHQNLKLGKAGRNRHLGRRPTVRGTVMNPNDHPHGGGEGKAPVGMAGPKTPWGKPALGYRTRGKKRSDKLIVRRRGKRR